MPFDRIWGHFAAAVVIAILVLVFWPLILSRLPWTTIASVHMIIFIALLPVPVIPITVTFEVLAVSFLLLGVMKEIGNLFQWLWDLRWFPGKVIFASVVYAFVNWCLRQWGPDEFELDELIIEWQRRRIG